VAETMDARERRTRQFEHYLGLMEFRARLLIETRGGFDYTGEGKASNDIWPSHLGCSGKILPPFLPVQ